MFLALALLLILVRSAAGGYPGGADTWGHLTKAQYLAEQMHLHGLWAYVTTAWMPIWYMGDPFRTYYPPLTTLVLAPIVYVVQDPVVAYQIFVTLFLALYAALVYAFLASTWGPWAGGLGGVLALLAPYQLRTLYFEGNLPRVLAVLALPLLAWTTERLLATAGRRMPWVIVSGLVWAWTILAHPQQAYMFAIGLAIYMAARLFLDADVPLRRSAYWVGGLVLGFTLSAPWSLPAYSHGELPNVPYLPVEKVALFSAPTSALLPGWMASPAAVSVGTGVLALAILAAISRPEPKRTAWLLSGLVTIWLAFGPPGVLFSLVPLSNQLLPERFLNYTSLALPIAAAGILPFRVDARALRAAVVAALVVLDAVPAFGEVRNVPFPQSEAAMGHALAQETGSSGARTALLTFPEPTALQTYYAGQAAPEINGWALENTPQQDALRRYLGAAQWGPSYLAHLFSLWNVKTAVVAGTETEVAPAAAALQSAGYDRAASAGDYQIWSKADPPGYVQAIPENQMLVVGDRLNPFLGAFPFAQEADNQKLSALPADALTGHPVVGLYQFEPPGSTPGVDSQRLRSYLESGGTVVADLSGMESQFGQTLDFFGVTVVKLSLRDSLQIHWQGAAAGLPASLPLAGVAPEGWSGAAYQGLDKVLGQVSYEGRSFPVLGYRQVGKGRLWLVGLNLLYYAQETSNSDLMGKIRDAVLSDTHVDTSLSYPSVPITDWKPSGTGLSFTAGALADVRRALISYTYSPRFRATIDGAPVPLASYQHMMMLKLPAGVHTVEIQYHPYGTIWPWAGLGIGLLGVLLAAGAYELERRTFLPLPAKSGLEIEEEQEYAPCSNCGFLLAEIGPPTAITYPFQVVSCPICGMKMDDEGFEPGRPIDEAEKKQRLADWLAENDYDATTVHERWGFAYTQFFDTATGNRSEGLEGGAPSGEVDEAESGGEHGQSDSGL